MNFEEIKQQYPEIRVFSRISNFLFWLVAALIGLALLSGAVFGQPGPVPGLPFDYDPPPEAPKFVDWFVAEPNQTLFFEVKVWSKKNSVISLAVANADPNGPIWDFVYSDPNVAPVDANDLTKGYKRHFVVGWTVPESEDVCYLRVTATIETTDYGYHDKRPPKSKSDSGTYAFWIDSIVPPAIYVNEPPVIVSELYQQMLKRSSGAKTKNPTEPIRVAKGHYIRAPRIQK